MKMRTLVALMAIFLVASCKNSQQASSEPGGEKSMVEPTVQDGNWESSRSASDTYTLFYEVKDDVQNPKIRKAFYIVDASGEKVYENAIYGGYVKWLDATKVEYFSPPGVMPANSSKDDFIMIYDLESGKTYKKSSVKN